MGAGKSYEAVAEKLVPCLKNEGPRRVVTNIEGLNRDKIAEYTRLTRAEIDERLITVDYERVAQEAFWYDPERAEPRSVVQPGDLVVIDEAWRYFNRNEKLSDETMRFLRMHRHYVGASGHTCDVVLLNQALTGLHRDVRDVVELTIQCRKLKQLGQPTRYQARLIEGRERKPSHTYLRSYRPEIFPLYSSYAGTQPGAEALDRRQSVFRSNFFRYVVPLAVVAIVTGGALAYRTLRNIGGTPPAPAGSNETNTPTAVTRNAASPNTHTQNSAATRARDDNDDWRLVATYTVNGMPVGVLVDSAGRYRTALLTSLSIGAEADIRARPYNTEPGYVTPWSGPEHTYRARGTLRK